jgi:hypothetical protein
MLINIKYGGIYKLKLWSTGILESNNYRNVIIQSIEKEKFIVNRKDSKRRKVMKEVGSFKRYDKFGEYYTYLE